MQAGESPSYRRRRYFGYVLAAGVSVVVFWMIVVPALQAQNFGITFFPDGRIEIRDFPSILVFAKAFWKGTANYDVQSYISATSEWAGRPLDIALPFPYSPTMLWLLGPFCPLPTAWAFTLWTILGLCVVWRLAGPRWPIWVGVAFFSPTAMLCFSLGQTVLLSTAALLFLSSLYPASGREPAEGSWRIWVGGVVLWALSAKPQVAVTAGLALVGARQWRILAVALAMTAFSTLLLAPRLGVHGFLGYLGMLAHYDTQTTEFFGRNLFPEKMGNLRALLHITFGLGDTLAFRCSAALWVCALVGLLCADTLRRLDNACRWCLFVLAYLLFCPHLIASEELHLVLILALMSVWAAGAGAFVPWAAVALGLAVLFLPVLQANAIRIAAVFGAKVGLAGLLSWRSAVLRPVASAVGGQSSGFSALS